MNDYLRISVFLVIGAAAGYFIDKIVSKIQGEQMLGSNAIPYVILQTVLTTVALTYLNRSGASVTGIFYIAAVYSTQANHFSNVNFLLNKYLKINF